MPLALYYCLLLFILVVAYIPFVHEKAPSISLIESVIRATCNHLSKNRALKSSKCFTHTFQPSVHSLCLIPLFFLIFRLQTLTMKYFVNWLFYKKLNIISVRYWLYTHWWSFPPPFWGDIRSNKKYIPLISSVTNWCRFPSVYQGWYFDQTKQCFSWALKSLGYSFQSFTHGRKINWSFWTHTCFMNTCAWILSKIWYVHGPCDNLLSPTLKWNKSMHNK